MQFEVDRSDFRNTRAVAVTDAPLEPGQIRLSVERFAVTTNNITYAVAGDMLDYWGFFPADHPWGRLPAMALSTVVESANAEIPTGGRYFGFAPMATQHVLDAAPRGSGFRDVGGHRAPHAPVYTDFLSVADDAMFRAERADEYLLFRGLFLTSFLVDDYLADNDFRDATQTIVTSASSKTSIALADCLRRRGHHRIGLTSPGNRRFVEDLDLYDEVLTYDQIADLDPAVHTGLVDMAGNGSVRSTIHNHFADTLGFSLTVGVTHWEEPAVAPDLPGPTPEFFFAPSQAVKRTDEWGADELENRIASGFHSLIDGTDAWLTVTHRTGAAGVEAAYRELLEGSADPASGFVVSMHDQAEL